MIKTLTFPDDFLFIDTNDNDENNKVIFINYCNSIEWIETSKEGFTYPIQSSITVRYLKNQEDRNVTYNDFVKKFTHIKTMYCGCGKNKLAIWEIVNENTWKIVRDFDTEKGSKIVCPDCAEKQRIKYQ